MLLWNSSTYIEWMVIYLVNGLNSSVQILSGQVEECIVVRLERSI
jgi:hypothetical protein